MINTINLIAEWTIFIGLIVTYLYWIIVELGGFVAEALDILFGGER